jgi:hypothetical protein
MRFLAARTVPAVTNTQNYGWPILGVKWTLN